MAKEATREQVARRRLVAQRISVTSFTRPAEVVTWLGAVQAQDYLGALWAVGLRLLSARERDIERALADRSIVRTWPLRGTLHFVAAADARWVIDLVSPRIVLRAARRLRELGLDDATLSRARRVLGKRLGDGRPMVRHAVYEALEREKISTAGQRGIHILWRLAQECFLCFGPREHKQQTFVLFDAWLPEAKTCPREEGLAELAYRYFTGHGPATVADFAWWSGLSPSDARLAVDLAGSRLAAETIGSHAFWFGARTPRFPPQRSSAYLLPAFDEFAVGFRDRSAAVDPARAKHVNAGGGILKPIIVLGGQVVGTWQRRLTRAEVIFSPAPFVPLAGASGHAVRAAFRRYADFLGLRARG